MKKTCSTCNQEKDLDLFAKGNKYKDGRRGICKKCHADYISNYYKDRPEKYAEKVRMNSYYKSNWKRHKISEEMYLQLVSLHEGKCHACKDREATNIDHDHTCCPKRFSCGKCIRGVLCNQCNTALGLLSDSREKLLGLVDYIS